MMAVKCVGKMCGKATRGQAVRNSNGPVRNPRRIRTYAEKMQIKTQLPRTRDTEGFEFGIIVI